MVREDFKLRQQIIERVRKELGVTGLKGREQSAGGDSHQGQDSQKAEQ